MLGPQDLWIALALGVFFFGAKKLPELSRSLGQAMSEFKKGVSGLHDEPATPPAALGKPEAAAEATKPEATTPEATTPEATKPEATPSSGEPGPTR